MSASQGPPFSSSRVLPPYRALLIVDAKDFTGNPSVQHAQIAAEIPALVEEAFGRAQLSEIWDTIRFSAHTGDGVALGFPPEYLPYLVHPLLDELQRVLKERNTKAGRYDALIRLRASLHVGPLPDSGEERVGDGDGKPRNDAHRLLDSVAVKAMLAGSSDHVTYVAAILSQRVFEDVVQAGYAGRHPDHFIPVRATVPGKNFGEDAWLYVPEPSGSLFQEAVLGADVVREVRAPAEATPGEPSNGVRVEQNYGMTAGVVHGGMHQDKPTRDAR